MAYWSHKQYSKEAWSYLINQTNSDILLFQESFPNNQVLEQEKLIWNAIGGSRPWGSGIYSNEFPIREHFIKTSFLGSVVGSEIIINDQMKLIVISLYGLMEKIFNKSYSIPNLHRILSDLTELFESRDTKDRIILGGDFNASLQCDQQQRGNSHKVLFDRLHEFGLVNSFDLFFDDFIQTHRHNKSKKPWQNDYFFISKKLEKNLVNCEVLTDDKIFKYSDHNPVAIELSF